MSIPSTTTGRMLLEAQRRVFAELAELEKAAPADVDMIVRAIVEHVRVWKPVTLAQPVTQREEPTTP